MARTINAIDIISIQAALRDLWAAVDKLNNTNIDMGGNRKVQRAKIATDPGDYVPLSQVRELISKALDERLG